MAPRESRVSRTSDGLQHYNTLILRDPKVYAFWCSPYFIQPIAQGWYVHAASVKGENIKFNPAKKPPGLRWDHSNVDADGLVTDLVLYDGRSYQYYLTPKICAEDDLPAYHLPWEVDIWQTRDPAIVLCFPAQRLQVDDHGKEVPRLKAFDCGGPFRGDSLSDETLA